MRDPAKLERRDARLALVQGGVRDGAAVARAVEGSDVVGQGTGPRPSRADLAASLLTRPDDRAHLRASPVMSH